MLGDQQILQHGHSGEQPDILECARDPRFLRHQIIRHPLEQKQRSLRSRHAAFAAVGQPFERIPPDGSPCWSAIRPSVGL